MDKAIRHKEICKDLNSMFIAKNAVYGDSFSETYRDFGAISAATRIADKFNRMKALVNGVENKVTDESLKDTLLDLANYCIMFVMEMEANKDEEAET